MSPEQAGGAAVDKRGDIWAFGCVLYEMLTGKRAFAGATTSDILAAVLKEDPDWGGIPARVQPLLRRCLGKDPKRRMRDIGDAMPLLDVEPEPVHAPRIWPWVVAAVFALAFAAVSFNHFRETPPRAELIRFQIPPPEANGSFAASPFLSPNGRMIAFSARGPAGLNILWVRSLDTLEARALTSTEDVGISSVFWSPDSRFIGFATQGKLKKVAVSGGAPQTLCDLPGSLRGGAWSRNGVIVFGSQRRA